MRNQVLHFDRALGFSKPGKKREPKDSDDETHKPA